MDEVKVRVSKSANAKSAGSVNRRRLQSSTTLNRRFVKKPTPAPRIKASAGAASRALKTQTKKKILISKGETVQLQPVVKEEKQIQIAQETEKVVQEAQKQVAKQPAKQQQGFVARAESSAFSLKDLAAVQAQIEDEPVVPAQEAQVARAAKARMVSRRVAAQPQQHMQAREAKTKAIERAIAKVSALTEEEEIESQTQKRHFWQRKKFVAAASMAVVSLILLGYLVSVNLPDISVRVAAMHSGIEKAYPSYVPASYRLDGLVNENNGRITMSFKNDRDQKFTLMEEKSSWDSSAVLTNYVEKNWGASYSIAKGQGLTIYVSGSNAAWVNGGVFYVIEDESGSLSSSDLHDIAVSL
ncbi:hypothetical protein IKG13_03025 [Candidatus Saccharibacteria bacterium]|nr:hypothetical protein [Candidatus Saccharibacteria bacterium]